MATECDNEEIVIEESVRSSFYEFLDEIAEEVFTEILDAWALRLLSGGGKDAFFEGFTKAGEFSGSIVSTINQWLRLELPDALIANMPAKNKNLLDFLFQQMNSPSEDNQLNATETLVFLVHLSQSNIKLFQDLYLYMVQQVQQIQFNMPKILQENNLGKAEKY